MKEFLLTQSIINDCVNLRSVFCRFRYYYKHLHTVFAEIEIMLNCFQIPRRKYRVEPSENYRNSDRNRKWARGNEFH